MNTSYTPDSEFEIQETLIEIPENMKTRSVWNQFWIWCGANVAPIMWILGALGIQIGLSLKDTILVLVVGNAIGMMFFGFMVLLGQRTGAPGVILSRYVLGHKGNYLTSIVHTVIMFLWLAVNTWVVLDLVMALLGKLGLVNPSLANTDWRILVGVLIMITQVVIALAGYRVIAAFERYTVPLAMVVMAAMSIAAWFFIGVNWDYPGVSGHILTGVPKLAAISSIMTVIGIGWGMTWFIYADDYSRFVAKDVSKVKLFLASAGGQYLPTVWLGILGATLATHSVTTDPGQMIVNFFGVLAIPVLFLVLHGPIATNILNIYSCALGVQATDLNVPRKWITIGVGAAGTVVMIYLIFNANLGNTLSSFLSASIGWVTPWAAIMFVHYYWILRNREVPVAALFESAGSSPLPSFNWAGYVSIFAGMFSAWLCMYGAVPSLQGPIARMMGGVDLTWVAGLSVTGVIYAVLGPIAYRRGLPRMNAYLSAR